MLHLIIAALVFMFQCSGGASIDNAACATALAGESQSQAYLARQHAILETSSAFTADAITHEQRLQATQAAIDATNISAAWSTATAPKTSTPYPTPLPTPVILPSSTPAAVTAVTAVTVVIATTPAITATVHSKEVIANEAPSPPFGLILGLALLIIAAWIKWDWIREHMRW